MDAENRPIAVRREEVGGLGKKGEGIKQETKQNKQKQKTLTDTDNSMVVTREAGGRGGRRG